jgi:hypothetical protein
MFELHERLSIRARRGWARECLGLASGERLWRERIGLEEYLKMTAKRPVWTLNRSQASMIGTKNASASSQLDSKRARGFCLGIRGGIIACGKNKVRDTFSSIAPTRSNALRFYRRVISVHFPVTNQCPATNPCLRAIPFNGVRSGRGHESFLQGFLGTRNLVHYLFRHLLNGVVFKGSTMGRLIMPPALSRVGDDLKANPKQRYD